MAKNKGLNGMHPGFVGAENDIIKKEGYSKKTAGKILAAGARNASAKAKTANPDLKNVTGYKK